MLIAFVGLEKSRAVDDLAAAESLVATAPTMGEAHYNLGNALWSRGRLDDALAAFKRAAERLPDSSNVLNNLGGVLYDQGELDRAIGFYQQALSLDDHGDAGSWRSSSPLMPGDAASTAARPAIVEINLARALARRGDAVDAERHYRRALELDPALASAHLNLAGILAYQGHDDQAAQHYRAALAHGDAKARQAAAAGLAQLEATQP